MANAKIWKRRVAAWKASGLTATAFCAREGLGRRALHHWVGRLPPETSPPVAEPVRLARLVRSPPSSESPPVAAPAITAALVIEVGGARVTVARDADLGMVATVLALVGGGAAR